MTKRSFFILLAMTTFLLSLSITTWGQGTFSRLTGVVQDANGAAVAGATVTLIKPES